MIMSIGTTPAAGGPQPLAAVRLSDQLAARLAAQIEGGELKPGDRLPTEQQLGEAHGVSRTVVREAMHQLKSRRLVRARQGSGVYVEPPQAERALAFDAGVLDSIDAMFQVAEVRRTLEGEIAALAARRASRRQVAAIRRAVAALAAAKAAGGDGVEEDLAFHRAVAEATGNPQFGHVLGFLEQYLRDAIRVSRADDAMRRDYMETVHAEHRAIAEAIAAGDAAAARRAALRHMLRGEERLRRGGVVVRAGRPAGKPAGASGR